MTLVMSAGRRGVTLIEAVLFISIALGLIVGGIVFFQQSQLNSRVMSQARVVVGLVSETRGLLRTVSESVDAHYDPVMIAAGAVPPEIVASSPTRVWMNSDVQQSLLLNAWGEPMSIEVRPEYNVFTLGPGTVMVRVAMFGLPVAACARLAVVDAGGGGVAVGTARVTWRIPRESYEEEVRRNRHVYIGSIPPNPQPAADTSVVEVTPSYAADRCRDFSLNGRVELVLTYFIDI